MCVCVCIAHMYIQIEWVLWDVLQYFLLADWEGGGGWFFGSKKSVLESDYEKNIDNSGRPLRVLSQED